MGNLIAVPNPEGSHFGSQSPVFAIMTTDITITFIVCDDKVKPAVDKKKQ